MRATAQLNIRSGMTYELRPMRKNSAAPIYTPKRPARFLTGEFTFDVNMERSEKLKVIKLVKIRIATANNIIAWISFHFVLSIYRPVWPNPPDDLTVLSRESFVSISALMTSFMTICAIRSPRFILNGSLPWLIIMSARSPL